MRIGDGIDFTQGIQAASSLQFNQSKVTKSGDYDSTQTSDARASLGVDSASVGGVNLDIAMKGAESAAASKRAANVQNIKEQVQAGTYNVGANAILDAAPQLVELVG